MPALEVLRAVPLPWLPPREFWLPRLFLCPVFSCEFSSVPLKSANDTLYARSKWQHLCDGSSYYDARSTCGLANDEPHLLYHQDYRWKVHQVKDGSIHGRVLLFHRCRWCKRRSGREIFASGRRTPTWVEKGGLSFGNVVVTVKPSCGWVSEQGQSSHTARGHCCCEQGALQYQSMRVKLGVETFVFGIAKAG